MKFQATLPVLAFYFVLVIEACASERESAGSGGAGPVLIPLDSVLLVEADTLYIGNPFTPVVDPFDGTIYVPDLFSNRVMRFGRDGSLIRVYGRPRRKGSPKNVRALMDVKRIGAVERI